MRRMPGWKITLEPEEEQRAEERARVKCPGQRDHHPALRAGVTEEHHCHPWCPGLLCAGWPPCQGLGLCLCWPFAVLFLWLPGETDNPVRRVVESHHLCTQGGNGTFWTPSPPCKQRRAIWLPHSFSGHSGGIFLPAGSLASVTPCSWSVSLPLPTCEALWCVECSGLYAAWGAGLRLSFPACG